MANNSPDRNARKMYNSLLRLRNQLAAEFGIAPRPPKPKTKYGRYTPKKASA